MVERTTLNSVKFVKITGLVVTGSVYGVLFDSRGISQGNQGSSEQELEIKIPHLDRVSFHSLYIETGLGP